MNSPRIGAIKVADLAAHYSGADYSLTGFAIEEYGYHNFDDPCWAVPAWDERGLSHLEGPFATREEAEAALLDALAQA